MFIGVSEDIAAKINGVKNVYNATGNIPLAAVITASTTHKKKSLSAVEQLSELNLVGVPGLEPGKAGPESAVLPLHHTPICF